MKIHRSAGIGHLVLFSGLIYFDKSRSRVLVYRSQGAARSGGGLHRILPRCHRRSPQADEFDAPRHLQSCSGSRETCPRLVEEKLSPAIKILQYLMTTKEFGLTYWKVGKYILGSFAVLSREEDVMEDHRSISVGVETFGGELMLWSLKLRHTRL